MGESKSLVIFFATISIVTLLLISESAMFVHAQTLNRDFGVTILTDDKSVEYCSFDVSVKIQTEPQVIGLLTIPMKLIG